jgi:hypothetical protein
MPNYCFNTLIVEGKEVDIRKFVDENKGEHSLSLIKSLPIPTDPSPENSVDWRSQHWGTTRDIDSKYSSTQWVSSTEYTVQFESAWSPPDTWVKYVSVLYPTLKFSLYYDEPNCRFRGNLVVDKGNVIQETCEEDYESCDEDSDDEDDDSRPDSVS